MSTTPPNPPAGRRAVSPAEPASPSPRTGSGLPVVKDVLGRLLRGARTRPSGLVDPSKRVDLALVVVLLAASAVLFVPPFDSPTGGIVAGVGAALGVLVGLVSARDRLGLLPTLAATGGVHVLLAPWILPDVGSGLSALGTVLAATVTVWRDALTLPLPLSAFPTMSVLPWLTGLCCAVAATRATMAGRVHIAGLTLLLQPTVAIAWGGQCTIAPTILGAAIIVGVLLLWALTTQRGRRARVAEVLQDPDAGIATDARRGLLRALSLLTVTALVVVLAVPAAPHPRTALRDLFLPPLDLTQYATPLSLVRTLETDMASTTLLTLSGLPEGSRIRVAALDSYDGLSARLGQDATGAARFQRAGQGTPLVVEPHAVNAQKATSVRITVEGYSFPWVPTVSDTMELRASGPRASSISESLYYDPFSATGIVTAGLSADDVLTERVEVPVVPADEELAKLPVLDVPLGPVEDVPASVESLATALVGTTSEPMSQIRILQQALRAGFYSDGTTSRSEPGHGAARIASMVEAGALVGDDEQYAVLMMLMCRSLGIPARVVMGFEPDTDSNPADVTGEDISAWVEVPFESAGWVAFDVTPDREQVPQQQTTQKVSNPEPQVLQPPLPLQDPAELPPAYEDEDGDDSDDDSSAIPPVLIGVLVSLAALGLPVGIIMALKALRRHRRRRRPGVEGTLGAWREVVDRANDLGHRAPSGATRRETAAVLAPGFPTADLRRFARAIDAQIFGSGVPPTYAVNRIWESVDVIVPAMGADRSLPRRVMARLSVRSLLRSAKRWQHTSIHHREPRRTRQ